MTDPTPTLSGAQPILFKGNVNTWECDEMGHMNVRFFVGKAQQALAVLGHTVGLGPDHQRTTGTALTVSDHHIRFLQEVHAGAGIYATGGLVSCNADGFEAVIELRENASHAPLATFLAQVDQTDPDMGARIPLPPAALAAMRSQLVPIPEHAKPRGVERHAPAGDANLARAEELGLVMISHGVVLTSQCNENGLMHTQNFIGQVSDGVVNLLQALYPSDRSPREPGKRGGAAVEYRLSYNRRPRAGDIITVRSGLKALGNKTLHLVHWILDAVTGEPLATSEAVALSLDLETRKSLPLSEEVRRHMETKIIPGLSA